MSAPLTSHPVVKISINDGDFVTRTLLQTRYKMAKKNDSSSVLNFISSSSLTPVILFVIAIPVSMLMWLGNLAFSFVKDGSHLDEMAVIPPTRWLAAVLTPLLIVAHSIRKKSLDRSGGILAFFVGFILTLGSYSFLVATLTFFATSTKATKFREERKRKLEENFKEGGQRNWIQVLCNSGMATQLALLYLLDLGSGERVIDFYHDYRGSWLSVGIIGACACCNGDTWASELGTVFGDANPYLITTWKKVPRGTNGGVTFLGLVFSFFGGAVIGLGYYLSVIYLVDSSIVAAAPPQWPLILVGALAGLVGSVVDSLLGATLQYSGVDEKTGIVVERSGKGVRYISGMRVLDNHSVNIISTIIMGLVSPKVAHLCWP